MKRRVMLVLVIGLAFTGCSGATHDAERSATGESVADFVAYVRLFQHDYQPAPTPMDLAALSDIVVSGTILAAERGQSYAPTSDSEAVIATSMIEVSVDRVLWGDASLVVDGSVYIEVPHPAFVAESEEGPRVPFDHAAFSETVPKAYGIFFLEDRTKEPYWDTVLDEGAGRPAGAPLTAAYVQGFLIEDMGARLVSVNEPLDTMPSAWQALESLDAVEAEIG